MDLSIIIVNWNSKEFLGKCLASIFAETRGLEFEIIVIDSASFDGCARMLREHYPEVRFIQSDKNLGFAKANNQAFQASTGDCVLFLNPDTELLGPAINIMYERLRTLSEVGVLGCKLLNSDLSLQTSCLQSFPSILNQVLDANWLRSRWPKSSLWGTAPLYEGGHEPKVVEAIAGACIMLKRGIFEGVGMFSEEYFMYAEDIDLCYKVQQAGYHNYYTPVATVVHYGGGSSQTAASNFSNVMTRESLWRFLRKWRGMACGMSYRASMLVASFIRLGLLVALLPFHPAHLRCSAWRSSFLKWRAILRWSVNREAWVKEYS